MMKKKAIQKQVQKDKRKARMKYALLRSLNRKIEFRSRT